MRLVRGPVPRTLTYAPAQLKHPAPGPEFLHATITRRFRGRWRDQRFTLCDRGEKRRVAKVLRNTPLSLVDCIQCRKQLEEDGMLEPPSPQ